MTAQAANGATIPVGSDGWNLTAHLKTLIETVRVIIPVADQTARDNLAAGFPGGVLPVPSFAYRADLDLVQTWNGSAWTGPGQATPYRVAAGTASFIMGNNASTTLAVSFPAGRFTQPPIVSLGKAMSVGANFAFAVTGVTTTGFTLYAQTVSGAASTAAVASYWTATQMTPTSGAG